MLCLMATSYHATHILYAEFPRIIMTELISARSSREAWYVREVWNTILRPLSAAGPVLEVAPEVARKSVSGRSSPTGARDHPVRTRCAKISAHAACAARLVARAPPLRSHQSSARLHWSSGSQCCASPRRARTGIWQRRRRARVVDDACQLVNLAAPHRRSQELSDTVARLLRERWTDQRPWIWREPFSNFGEFGPVPVDTNQFQQSKMAATVAFALSGTWPTDR
jgi:hypothetical protein